MEVVLVECPGDRRVLLCGRLLVYAEGPDSQHPLYDAEWIAEQLVHAAGVGVQVHHVWLPADFATCDEDGPLPGLTPEDVRDWWVSLCDAAAEEAVMAGPPPAYPTLGEQLLGVVGYAGLEVSDEVRRLVAELEKATIKGMGGQGQ